MTMVMTRPGESDYAPAYGGYVALVPEDDILSAMELQSSEVQKFLASLDEARCGYRYAPGKWSVREVIGHIVDAERIMGYRALAIARGEEQSLPGYDENMYVETANFDDWKLGELAELYALSRRANIVFFKNLRGDVWDRRGTANDAAVSVRALAYVIVGHVRHHQQVLRERYGM